MEFNLLHVGKVGNYGACFEITLLDDQTVHQKFPKNFDRININVSKFLLGPIERATLLQVIRRVHF